MNAIATANPATSTGTRPPTQATVDRATALASYRAQTLSHYTQQQQDAALFLYSTARTMLDTGGGSTCSRLLLGIYNGNRFPFDLTDLRRLDNKHLAAALTVLHMDASRTWVEIHVLLDAILNVPPGKSTGHTFEVWAHRLGLKGRCSKANLASVLPGAA